MKKGLLSLLALALTVVGCQNYDDQFDALTELIEGVQADVDGLSDLQDDVDALSATIAGLATAESVQGLAGSISDIEDDVADVAGDITPLAAALSSLASEVADIQAALDSEAVDSAADLAALTAQLNSVQSDLDELLAANNVIEQALNIKSVPTLEYAESLISTGTDAPLAILNKDLTITSTFANDNAALTARINAIAEKIKTVLGDVTITHSASSVVQLPALTFADSDVTINTANTLDALVTVTGQLNLNVPGAISAGALTEAATIVVDPNITSLDMTGVTIENTLYTKGQGTKTISAPKATGTINAGSAVVTSVIANKALTVILGFTTYEAVINLDTASATTINIAAKTAGDIDISADKNAVVTISDLTKVGTITTTEVEDLNIAKLATVSQSLDLSVDGDLTTTALKSITDSSTIAKLETFNAPVLSMTNTLSLADATTITVKNIAAAHAGSYAGLNGNKLVAPKVKTLTISELGATRALYIDGDYSKLETLSVTGKDLASPTPSTQTASIVITTGAAELDSVVIDGQVDAIDVQNGDDITSFTTAETAEIRYLHLKGNSELTTLSLGHAHIDGGNGAELIVDNNNKITAITATNFDEAEKIAIQNNDKLASLSFPSLDTKITSTSVVVSVTDNNLSGTYLSATVSQATTPFRYAKLKSDDLLDLYNYINLYPATSTPTFEFNISNVTSKTQVAATGAEGTAATYTDTLADIFFADTELHDNASETNSGTSSTNVSNVFEASYFYKKGSIIAE